MARSSYFPRHRLDALVDAVLAITMTLLVLELGLPNDIHGDLFGALRHLEPKLVSWIVSFLILALCWERHVIDFREIQHVDTRLFWLVTLWLLVTSVLPFSSSIIGEHGGLPGAHLIYALNLVAIQLVVLLRDLYLKAHPNLFNDGKAGGHDIGWATALIITLCACASIAAERFAPNYSATVYILIWPLSALARRFHIGVKDRAPSAAPEDR